MPENVIKRNGTVQAFDIHRIETAVRKAMSRTKEQDKTLPITVAKNVTQQLSGRAKTPTVDEIHTLVENELMRQNKFDVAREYITYRDRHKPDIFRPRKTIKPYEYPHLVEYSHAINEAHWTFKSYNYKPDIQDLKVNLSSYDAEVINRTMLAISTIEVVAVKKFWTNLDQRLPKHEISHVGAIFGASEIRHFDAYSHLLEIMGLNNRFDEIHKVPEIKRRLDYLEKFMEGKNGDNKDFALTVMLFSLFIENVSLFSQFLIIMQYNKVANVLKGMSNAVQATSKEEMIHALFGIEIIKIIRKEHPEWFDKDLHEKLNAMIKESFEAEEGIVNWIFQGKDSKYLTRYDVIHFLKNRYNQSMEMAGFEIPFKDVDQKVIDKFEWFDVETKVAANNDHFNKHGVGYSVADAPITEDDVFN